MNTSELYQDSHEATYCPEDNKIRLYVGRVPRDEYLSLRSEGWTSTPKQECDFVATYTPQREDTAKAYAGIILDEDQSPQDRAVDRAERFAEYRDKRTSEATGHADRYDTAPASHGYQSQAKAERAAARHDKHADRSLSAWDKAEYWTSRTAGVISNALYLSSPGVRMGRIKKLETELRRYEASPEYYGRWVPHTRNRLAYENQMLEAVGGRASVVEMEKGGTYSGKLITQVIKSKASGVVTSVKVRTEGTRVSLRNIERDKAGEYQAPTDESRAELAAFLKARTAETKARNAGKPKLINPTDEDAQRLQDLWNEQARSKSKVDQEVLRLTQAQYSAHSGGSYSHLETVTITEGGREVSRGWNSKHANTPSTCKIRKGPGTSSGWSYAGCRVVVITDKPQKPLPAATFTDPRPAMRERIAKDPAAMVEAYQAGRNEWHSEKFPPLFIEMIVAGLVNAGGNSTSWTAAGEEAIKPFYDAQAKAATVTA